MPREFRASFGYLLLETASWQGRTVDELLSEVAAPGRPEGVDALVFAMTRRQLQAVLHAFGMEDVVPVEQYGTRFYRGRVHSVARNAALNVVVVGVGRTSDSTPERAIGDALWLFSARTYFVIDTVATLSGKIALGDVLIPQRVAVDDGLPDVRGSPRPFELPATMADRIQTYSPARTAYHRTLNAAIDCAAPHLRLMQKFKANPEPTVHRGGVALSVRLDEPSKEAAGSPALAITRRQARGVFEWLMGKPWVAFYGVSHHPGKPESKPWEYAAAVSASAAAYDFLVHQFESPGGPVF